MAAAAFAPFVTGVHPSFLDLESFAELEALEPAATFEQPDYLKWRALRTIEDSRFLGLTMPRVLRRRPHTGAVLRGGFCFREDVGAPHSDRYLWGTAVYALAAVVARCFARSGWLADIRGVRRGEMGGGVVTGLPIQSFATDRTGIAAKFPADVIITDQLEKQISELSHPADLLSDTSISLSTASPRQQAKVRNKPCRRP